MLLIRVNKTAFYLSNQYNSENNIFERLHHALKNFRNYFTKSKESTIINLILALIKIEINVLYSLRLFFIYLNNFTICFLISKKYLVFVLACLNLESRRYSCRTERCQWIPSPCLLDIAKCKRVPQALRLRSPSQTFLS